MSCDCGYQLPKRGGSVSHRSTEHVLPEDGIDRDAFGGALHDALFAIGEIQTLRTLLGRAALGELPKRIVADCTQKEAVAIGTLRTSLLKLAPHDVTAIVQQYPWVAAC